MCWQWPEKATWRKQWSSARGASSSLANTWQVQPCPVTVLCKSLGWRILQFSAMISKFNIVQSQSWWPAALIPIIIPAPSQALCWCPSLLCVLLALFPNPPAWLGWDWAGMGQQHMGQTDGNLGVLHWVLWDPGLLLGYVLTSQWKNHKITGKHRVQPVTNPSLITQPRAPSAKSSLKFMVHRPAREYSPNSCP